MNKLFNALILGIGLVLFCPSAAQAADLYRGTITATTTSKSNSSTAVPFTLLALTNYAIVCDATAYVQVYSDVNAKASATNGVKVLVDLIYDIPMPSSHVYISVVAASGTVNCKIFLVKAN